jgi:hypothetical protein
LTTSAARKISELHASRSEEEYEEKYIWDKERGEAIRPFRLWDAVNRKNIRWRYYEDKKRAHMAALIECRWLPIGASIEVYDCRTGRLLGQYTRRVDSIRFVE